MYCKKMYSNILCNPYIFYLFFFLTIYNILYIYICILYYMYFFILSVNNTFLHYLLSLYYTKQQFYFKLFLYNKYFTNYSNDESYICFYLPNKF